MFFDELKLGMTVDTAPAVIEKEKMLAFAREYDNIPLHVDEEYCKTTHFGKSIAPGVMSFMAVWAKYLDVAFFEDALLAGKSSKIEWVKPVFAEDVLTGKATITKLVPRSEKNGLVELSIDVYNQDGELVLTNVTEAVVKCRKKILETERLFLREMTMSDFDALFAVLADPEIMQHYPYSFDEERVRSWIERNMNRYKNDGFGLWAVCLKETGEMIGDCGLTLQNIDGEMLPEIGYHIRKDQQRKGYAKEAASAVRDWAFTNTEYPALYSYCKYTNEGSFKTAESIGMHFEKEYPDEDNKITHVSVIRREDLK